jgi:NAD(P)-dependent dehydrogenase (short-subunit alcohol dehydrogenase family)
MAEVSVRGFEGRRVVVIGSGGPVDAPDDIGAATAIAFAREGAEVALAQPSRALAEGVAAEIEGFGGTCKPLLYDPSDPASIDSLAALIGREWPGLEALVTHHLATDVGGIEDITLEQWERTIRVNLTGVFAATKAFLPLLRTGRDPSIVHVSSVDGRLGNPNILSYSAAKGGVHALVHTLAGELARYGIRVNAIERAASNALPVHPRITTSLMAATPLARIAAPAEYAAAIVFLASTAASYITGVTLPVDGGRTAVTPGTSPGYRGYDADQSCPSTADRVEVTHRE